MQHLLTVGDASTWWSSARSMSRAVAITGVGAVTPLGVGARTLHERWAAGRVRDRGRRRALRASSTRTSTCSTKEARRADRFTQLALAASDEALADAGWDGELPYDPDRVGCVIGTGIGGITTLETQHDVLRERGPTRSRRWRPADDGQRRRRGGLDAPRPARAVLRHRLGLRRRRPRDRRRRCG